MVREGYTLLFGSALANWLHLSGSALPQLPQELGGGGEEGLEVVHGWGGEWMRFLQLLPHELGLRGEQVMAVCTAPLRGAPTCPQRWSGVRRRRLRGWRGVQGGFWRAQRWMQ